MVLPWFSGVLPPSFIAFHSNPHLRTWQYSSTGRRRQRFSRVDHDFVRSLCLLLCLLAPASRAQIVVAIVDAQNTAEAQSRKMQRACEAALAATSPLTVGEGPALRKGAPRKCTDDCTQELLKNLPPYVLALSIDGKNEKLAVEASFWADGRKLNSKRVEVSTESVDPTAKSLVESVLPVWARRGWAAVVVPQTPGVLVKIDGRPLTGGPGELAPVTAGKHAIDVLSDDGRATLTRVDITEGSRATIDTRLAPLVVPRAMSTAGITPLRAISYTTFLVGALAIASGFIAGAVARWDLANLTACPMGSTQCATLDVAQARAQQANTITSTGNVLLGVGGGLAALGIGLFIVDVVTE
jgi:hypothetical protein